MSRLITDLRPDMQAIVKALLADLKSKEFRFTVIETLRDPLRQRALYAQGRSSFEKVNELRAAAGLDPLTADEAARKVTWVRKSKHELGIAIDIVPLLANGSIPWVVKNPEIAALWLYLGEAGERFGLAWGGRWDPLDKWNLGRDLPHFELKQEALT